MLDIFAVYALEFGVQCGIGVFPKVDFPFMSSNIPSTPIFFVYISQLLRCLRACSSYADFKDRIPCVGLSVCLSIYLFIYLFIYKSIYLYIVHCGHSASVV